MDSTTLISSAFTALLNCEEVGRQNRILTNYRFLSHSQPESFYLKTKVFRSKMITSIPATSPKQPDKHPLNCLDLYEKHPCPYGALQHPKGGSYLVKIHLPR